MYVTEKYLEADKLMVGTVAGFFEVTAEAEKSNSAEARDMMKDQKEIDPVWAEKVQEYGADTTAEVFRFMSSQPNGNA
tara:strand:- start:252 stop:485 length:234 start_codon:yes stop_codon:yes gene_type:complete